jgi:hypothetical protein
MTNIRAKLGRCQNALFQWSCRKYGHTRRRLCFLTRQLQRMQQREHLENLKAIKNIQEEIHHLLEMEDLHYKQQAKHNWFKNRDCNTRFSMLGLHRDRRG